MGGERRGVIFDVDGTLCDASELCLHATNQVLLAHNPHATPVSAHDYHAFTRYTTPERMARHLGLSPDAAGFEETGAALGRAFDDNYIARCTAHTAPLFPGMHALVRALHERDGEAAVALGCLTNAVAEYARTVLRVHGVGEWFASVHGADSVPKPKPNPDGLLLCCAELALPPAACVYVGDSVTDGQAARRAGMVGVGVTWGSCKSEQALAEAFDVVVRSPDDLSHVLTHFADTGALPRLS